MNPASIKRLLITAEESEQRARILQDKKPEIDSCKYEYGSEDCSGCKKAEFCEAMILGTKDEIRWFFESAWQGYHEVEALTRKYVQETDSIEGFSLLAQVLMDIHIHPNSGFERDTNALWESQYLWLHLYYRTGEQAYFDQAKLCDGIRNATVTCIQEG